MEKFLKLYNWELHNELFASMYFAGMLSMYAIEVLLYGDRSIDIFIMLEMLCVCYIIAIIQKIIFWNDTTYSKKANTIRTLFWFVTSMFLVIISSILFQWFINLQTWAMGAFIVYMVVFLFAMWLGIYVEKKIDTKNLNNMLSRYQEKSK